MSVNHLVWLILFLFTRQILLQDATLQVRSTSYKTSQLAVCLMVSIDATQRIVSALLADFALEYQTLNRTPRRGTTTGADFDARQTSLRRSTISFLALMAYLATVSIFTLTLSSWRKTSRMGSRHRRLNRGTLSTYLAFYQTLREIRVRAQREVRNGNQDELLTLRPAI